MIFADIWLMRPTMNQQNWAKVRQWGMITLCIALFSNISRGKKRFFGKVTVRQIRKSVKSVQLLMLLLCMHSAPSISVIVQAEKSKKMSSLLSTKWTICYSLTVKNTRSNKMSKKVCFSGLYFHTNMSTPPSSWIGLSPQKVHLIQATIHPPPSTILFLKSSAFIKACSTDFDS